MIEVQEKQGDAGEKETGRIEAFSDGVFAVAITLLVFNLKAPSLDDLKIAPEKMSLLPEILKTALLNQWPSYLSFLISFATILIMWVNHHSMFKLIHRSNTSFMFANGFLLLLVTVVPFPTQLVAMYLTTSAAGVVCAIYAGMFVVINVQYNILWWSTTHPRRLLKARVSDALVRSKTRAYLLGFPGYVIALLASFWSPIVSISICSVLWIFWALNSRDAKEF